MPDSGTTSERLEALRARWESDKGSRVFLQLADEYRRLGRSADAVRVLEEGLAANPRYPAAQVALGRCRLELGQAAEAAETLERVVASDPTQMVAYRLLVDAYVAQGRPQEARQRLRIYSLLNDADPDIAELRRRIGQLERQERSADETAAAPAPDEPTEADGDGVDRGEAQAPPADEPVEPFADLAAPAPGEAAGADPFPDLSTPEEGRRPEPEEDLFGLTPAPRATVEAGAAADPFDLDLDAPPAVPDLSSLLEGAPPPPAAPPEAEPAAPEEAEESREEAAPDQPVVLGEAPPEAAPPPGAPAADEPAPEEVPEPSPEPPTTAMETEATAGEPSTAPAPFSRQEEGRPTVTLGLLYLRQGHTREAEEIFRAVLDRDPDNVEALRHLEEIGEQLRAELAEPRRLTASDLLAGWETEPRERSGTTQRKRYVLERYREHIRRGARRDVH